MEDAILIDEIPGFSKGKENDIGTVLLEKVEGSHLNEDQKEDLLSLVSLYQDIFIEGIERLRQTPLLEFRVQLNDYSPLIQKPYVVRPVLEEIMKRLLQQYVDAGFYTRGSSQYVSPAFVVVKPENMSLLTLKENANIKSRLMRWHLALQQLNFGIKHVKGEENLGEKWICQIWRARSFRCSPNSVV